MRETVPEPDGARPRVLFAIGGLGTGGSEKQLVEVAARTHGQALDAIIVTWDPPSGLPNERRLEELGVTHHWIGPTGVARPLIPIVTAWRCARVLRAVRPDLAYTWLEEASLFFGPLARIHGVPVIVARRNVCGASIERYRLVSWLIRRSERMATLVSGNSQAVVDDAVSRGVRPSRLRLVPNAHEGVPPLAAPDASTVHLGYVARFRPEKGHRRLLQALALVETDVPWRIDLAGDGELMAAIEQEVAASGLADRVRFVGNISDVRAFWGEHHVAVLLSDHEGSPNALIEAAHAARPIVATAVGGIPEVVAPGGGLLVTPDDPAAIAAALKRMIEDDALRRGFGQAAYEQATSRFDADNVIAMHRRMVGEAIAAGERRPVRDRLRRWVKTVRTVGK
jgi:glycosyltransferase involved in cell wall biosynthesis